MRYEVKIILENGEYFYAKVNGTKKEIEKYYIGSIFNVGSVKDDMQKCVSVEFMDVEAE